MASEKGGSSPQAGPDGGGRKSGSALLAGGFAGMLAKTVVAPIERVKIMFQVTHESFSFRKIPVIMLEVCRRDGPRALWRGNLANMLRVAPYSGIQFMVYDIIKRHFEKQAESRPLHASDIIVNDVTPIPPSAYPDLRRVQEHMLAGAVAASVSTICTYPLDLARSRLAVIPTSKDGANRTFALVRYLKNWYRIGGMRELYRGLFPTVGGVTPYGAIAFSVNDTGKEMTRKLTGREPSTADKMLCGAFSGLTAQSLTYPLEMIRRNMQTHGFVDKHHIQSAFVEHPPQLAKLTIPKHAIDGAILAQHSGMHSSYVSAPAVGAEPPGIVSTARHIYAAAGIAGFFKGLLLNWVKGPVTLSISFTTYDIFKKYLDDLTRII